KILDKSPDPAKARRILNIVVAAVRPLTLREMNAAFKVGRHHSAIEDLELLSPRFETAVKNLCGLFVRVIDEKIYLVHQTAREFLIKGSSSGQGNWQYTMCSVDSNFLLADICLSYLALEDFENDLLPMGDNTAASASRDKYIQEHVLLEYAATNWPRHFRDSQGRQMELFDLTHAITKRGSGRFLTWLKVFWRAHASLYPFPNDFT